MQPPQQQLPPALQLHVLSFLPPNDRALSGRLVSPDTAAGLSKDPTCTASLSQPLPPHIAPWAVEAGQQHVRQLPFWHKLQLLCSATTSGSEVNLEVALALLQPSVFPELLQRWETYSGPNPGVAAVRAGHPQLLGWLLQRCPGLLNPDRVLQAAAEHCDLAGLQAMWELLRRPPVSTSLVSGWRPAAVTSAALEAAAGSKTTDAVAKMEWLVNEGGASCRPDHRTAAAAARSGDLGRLRWLHDRGCPMGGQDALLAALEHADLAVAQWLVGEAGCELPAAGSTQEWHMLLKAAASAQDAMAKLQWLGERGAPPLNSAADDLLSELARAAVAAGRVNVLQHLRSLPGLTPQQGQRLLQQAFSTSRVATSIPMLEYLQRAGVELTNDAYNYAAGRLDMVRWLAREGGCRPTSACLVALIAAWPFSTPAHSRDLLQAVQLVVSEAGRQVLSACKFTAEFFVHTAAARGHLAVVQYLLQQLPGYQPRGQLLADAAAGGCEALVERLVEQHPGCVEGPWGARAYVAPAKVGDRGTLAVLRRLGVPWGADDVMVRAVQRGCPLPVLRWLVEQGAPVGRAGAMEWALAVSECLSAEDGAWLQGLAAADGA